MRVAIVANSFPKLSETFIYNQVSGLREKGVDVAVVVHSRNRDSEAFGLKNGHLSYVRESPLARRRLPASLNAVLVDPARSGKQFRQAINLFGANMRTIRSWLGAAAFRGKPFDVIHFEFSGLAIQYLDMLPLLRPAKLLMSCRGAAEQIRPLQDAERRQQLAGVVRKMDLVHCVSEEMVRTMEAFGLERDRAFVNRPAIDTQKFRRNSPYQEREVGPIRLVSVGRLHWKKGFEYGIQAVKLLTERGFDVTYEIAGAGGEEEKLRFEIHNLKLGDRVRLLGEMIPNHIPTLLESADIFLLTSISEGLSNAALEAMCMGVPTVSTSAGGMDEAIQHGKTGFIVPPRSPDAIADRVSDLLQSPQARSRMSASAARHIRDEFSLEKQTGRFLDAYQRLVDGPARNHTIGGGSITVSNEI